MKSSVLLFAYRLWKRYTRHDVSLHAAALAYFLLFSLFPILILVSRLIGALDLSHLLSTLSHILPERVLLLVESYLFYAAEHTGSSLLWFSVIFSVWFPMRATDCLMHAVRRSYVLAEPQRPLLYRAKVLLYTVLLLLSIVPTTLVAVISRSAIASLAALLDLPEVFARLWNLFRFAAVGVAVLGALAALYAAAQDKRPPFSTVLPGAACSALAWIILSAVYSFYTEFFANYDLVYGALSTVAVVLIWLYLSAVALIMGAELNAELAANIRRKERPQKGETP